LRHLRRANETTTKATKITKNKTKLA
jgi:hypothetical protein